MHYKPTETELSDLQKMSAEQRMMYFLTRTNETEEVWSLGNDDGWLINESDDQRWISVWPYEVNASQYKTVDQEGYDADTVSLEHFVYTLLPVMIEQEILIDIFPVEQQSGKLLTAADLFEIIEQMIDTGQYFLEG